MKNFACFLGLLIGFNSLAQVTIVVDEFPENTPENATVFISGNFDGWSGGKKEYQLEKKENSYFITFPESSENLTFKFTQGSWESAECTSQGLSIDNRSYAFNKPNDTIKIQIAGWDNLFDHENVSTATKNVSIISEDFEISQLDRKRRVWMYLPPNYKTSNKSFPVVYMHDAQNLFDKRTSSYSNEWEVDETLNKLFKEHNFELIVVGIDHGGDKRLDEYSPWKNDEYGGGEGDAYMEFIVNTLKPYVDNHYKTLTDKSNTAIIGSSMGGLISYYAALEYPDIFGKVGVYSPAFWFAPEVSDFSKTNGEIQDTKIYFLAGGKEGENTAFSEISQTASDMNNIINVLKAQGFPPKNIQSKVVAEGKHNEDLWRNGFEETILWLFPEAINEREFVSLKETDSGLNINVSDGQYQIKFYSPEIIETTFIPEGEVFKNQSHAVVLKPKKLEIVSVAELNKTIISSEGIEITVQKQPFKISYSYKGNPITSEKNGYQKTDDFETIQFNLTEDEVLYGGGARALGMNRRGNRLELYNKAHYGYEERSELMNFTLPIVISSNQYMIHFDNAPIGFLDLDSQNDNTLTYETISGRKTYQIIVGDSWLDLIDNYTDLTGKQPMLPRWAFGNFSSRFGYHSQKEVMETIETFRDEDIPVDAIILDLYWFGKNIQGTMGNLEFFRDSFPNPKQMIKDLHNKNVETILITEPFILTTSNRWEEAVTEDILAKDSIGNPFTYDFYFGNTGLIDIYNPKGEQWFKNIYKDLALQGVNGFWGDLGEPEVHPSELLHATGTADEVHNIYGHDWAKLVYEASLEVNPNKRPFVLMRAGYSGSQRYGLVPWSGDVNRTWGGLQSQTEIALQMAMQGLAYMHSDLGGFAGANLDDELYTRWLQYGVFQPIFRPHAQEEVPSEPIFREEKTKNRAKKAIELRYQLLPYNYTIAFQNNQTGSPLMRPVFFDEPTNNEQLINANTYYWGEDFLVTPIVNPDVTVQQVYFPENHVWFDFYTDEKFIGGQNKDVTVSIENIPTYVKAGAFISLAQLVQSTKNYSLDNFDLHYYHDNSVEESERFIYNDDGTTLNAFEKEQYEKLIFEAEIEEKWLEIDFEAETGSNYKTSTKNIDLIIHNVNWQPKTIKIDGKKVTVNWDSEKNSLSIPVIWETSKELEINVKL
ncbi:TIM-barrel domain-containing protein [Bizionia arctica]|uniref:DUF5110 domain-containing protein n=1 Tax=Bizionia arctica TaxID=1495645 RepID=A0A917GE11_9FLAO|nr:TIM-barrel domain-containing protein [Bizionia arctica]GGG40147.1 hypothetical protein GCM10010976_09700 [Bizionia arctica]